MKGILSVEVNKVVFALLTGVADEFHGHSLYLTVMIPRQNNNNNNNNEVRRTIRNIGCLWVPSIFSCLWQSVSTPSRSISILPDSYPFQGTKVRQQKTGPVIFPTRYFENFFLSFGMNREVGSLTRPSLVVRMLLNRSTPGIPTLVQHFLCTRC
jgi:hypothetical protein